MDKQVIQSRIRELQDNQDAGQRQLAELERKKAELEHTLLRISGAITVLNALLADMESKQADSA